MHSKDQAILTRVRGSFSQTLGGFIAHVGGESFECAMLEPSWLFNSPFISCIPCGTYTLKKHDSPRFGKCFLIEGVKGRDNVLVHPGNVYLDTEGCQVPGTRFAHVDDDGNIDVVNSQKALAQLLDFLPDEIEYIVREADDMQKSYR